MQIYDISPEITDSIAVFPGDTPFKQTVTRAIDAGDAYALSHIKTTVHLGAHADAPNHYTAGGQDIASRDLSFYFGPAQVISVFQSDAKNRIDLNAIKTKSIQAPRVLFRTDSFPDPCRWRDDFTAIAPEVIGYLAAQGVRLIGIDTPSVDTANDHDLSTHRVIAKHDMAILEGIVLDKIEDGVYTLSAFPLKIKGADAAPVRAVLIR